MTRRRRLPFSLRVAVALAVCGLLGIGPAYAYWSMGAATSAAGQAETLSTPATPSVGSATAGSLKVNGTLPSAQVAGATYAVKRGATTICTPSASPFTCTDTGLANGTTYSYAVVASVGAWTAASAAASGTTLCTGPDVFGVVAPASATAGSAFTVSLTARLCDGTVDTAYAGAKALTWAAVAASPSGVAASLPPSATFTAGVASLPVTLYAAGSATLAPAAGAVTGTSSAVAVSAGAPMHVQVTNASSKSAPVTLTCSALTIPPTARTCTASDPQVNGKHPWMATPSLLDTWGNPAVTGGGLSVNLDVADGSGATVSSTFAIAAGSGSAAPFTASISNGGTVSIALSAAGLQTLTVTNAR